MPEASRLAEAAGSTDTDGDFRAVGPGDRDDRPGCEDAAALASAASLRTGVEGRRGGGIVSSSAIRSTSRALCTGGGAFGARGDGEGAPAAGLA